MVSMHSIVMITSYKPTTFQQPNLFILPDAIFLFFGYVLMLNTVHDADVRFGCNISVVEDQIHHYNHH
ncbi:hypothetical protein BLOT_014334 [Blomia tropicalis]|nr:hypothetical protein BLOT_014333 [Blomia tropicalis]KAI2796541.1 hypothetical protein BLOT_014334 [Blomia tropicalis]